VGAGLLAKAVFLMVHYSNGESLFGCRISQKSRLIYIMRTI